MVKKLLVEGWRGINHSYAMVNQYQLLELTKYNFETYHNDAPFFRQEWGLAKNYSGFDLGTAKLIHSIPTLRSDILVDSIYRISFPYNLTPVKSKNLFVFGTSEFQVITRDMVISNHPCPIYKNLPLTIVTPSKWSKEGFLNAGFRDEQVQVISHGVDLSIFKPLDQNLKNRYRDLLGADNNSFVILSVGAMTANKGIDILLLAYIQLKRKYPHLILVLKDQSNLYGFSANDFLNNFLSGQNINLSDAEINNIISSIVLIDQNLDLNQLNGLYNAADCYASPYRAEGFNLPPLEAASAGIPIIITEGGATDDYAHSSYALKISSKKRFVNNQYLLEPELDSLIDVLTRLIEKKVFGLDKSIARSYIEDKLSWKSVCRELVNLVI